MKSIPWWSPEPPEERGSNSAILLSRRWVQTYLFKMPELKRAELQASLRYKVRSTLPMGIEHFMIHTQILRRKGELLGAVFVVSEESTALRAAAHKGMLVGVPLFLPAGFGPKVLLLIRSPEGLEAHYYAEGLLAGSHAPVSLEDSSLRAHIVAQYPGAEVFYLAPDPGLPPPEDLIPPESVAPQRERLLDAFPVWASRAPSMLPQIAATVLLVAGIALIAAAFLGGLAAQKRRNELWRRWLTKAQAVAAAPGEQSQAAALLKAAGAPVPELFYRLARAWGSDTRILDLEWNQGKLVLTAKSVSALASLRKLTADPWFHDLRVDDIQLQKDGQEQFTVDGSPALDK